MVRTPYLQSERLTYLAFDAAQLEGSKAETRRNQFLTLAGDTRMKSLERSQKAAQRDNDRKVS